MDKLLYVLSVGGILLSNLSYFVSIAKGETRPSLSAMLVFVSSLGCVFASSLALNGNRVVIATLGANFLANFMSLCLSLYKRSYIVVIDAFEIFGLVGIVLSALAWWWMKDPWVALFAPTIIDSLGMLLLMKKLLHHPLTENMFAWGMASFAYVFSLVGQRSMTWESTMFPLSNMVLGGMVFLILLVQKRRLG